MHETKNKKLEIDLEIEIASRKGKEISIPVLWQKYGLKYGAGKRVITSILSRYEDLGFLEKKDEKIYKVLK